MGIIRANSINHPVGFVVGGSGHFFSENGEIVFEGHDRRSQLIISNSIVEVIHRHSIMLQLFRSRHIKQGIRDVPNLVLLSEHSEVHFVIIIVQLSQQNTSPSRALSESHDVSFWSANVVLGQRHVVGGGFLHEIKGVEICGSQTESRIREHNSDSISLVQPRTLR